MLDRIPFEIFRNIIKSSYADDLSISSSFDSGGISLSPIKATHVCRAWRSALLSDPTMWNCIMFVDKIKMQMDELKERLSRSGSAPLDVLIDHWWCDDADFILGLGKMLFVISQEMHRCRRLQIHVTAQLVHLVSHCLYRPVPLLQRFHLEVLEDDGDFKQRDMLREIHKILFSKDAPNLKYVCLQVPARMDDLQLSVFKNLSNLHLKFVCNAIVDGDVMLDLLQLSPCLRILNISWSLRQNIVLSMPSDRQISLPYLQELSLRGSCGVNMVDLVLGHLDFPTESVKFDITCDDSHSRISASTPLLHFLTRRRLTSILIDSGFSRLTFDFIERTGQELNLFPDGASSFRTMFRTTRALLDHLPNFLQTFNLADITDMYLGCASFKPEFLRSILVLFENLQCLRIHHGNVLEDFPLPDLNPMPLYLKALMPRLHSSHPQTQADPDSGTDDVTNSESNIGAGEGHLFPCPSLRTLQLLFCYEDLPVRLDEAYLQAVVQCFRMREQAGYSFRYIANCYRSSGLAEDFEALQAREGLPIEVRRSVR